MTIDQAIAVRVRVETAAMALKEAWKVSPVEEDDDVEAIAESIEEALQAIETALARLNAVIGP